MHRVLVLLLPLLSTLLVVQPTHAELLRVATEGNYAPFSYVDDSGQLTGFDVEIAQALCQQMQVQCQVQADSVEKVGLAAARRSDVPAVEVAASHFKLPFGVSLSVLAQV